MKTNARRGDISLAEANPYEVLTMAIAMERGAVRTYAALAKTTQHRLARAKFRYLAAEEREHARILGRMRKNLKRPKRAQKFPDTFSEAGPLTDSGNTAAVLREAIRAEQKAEAFYEECAARCRRAAARGIFKFLAAQEAGHEKELKDELKALSGPLPWSSLEGDIPEEGDYWT